MTTRRRTALIALAALLIGGCGDVDRGLGPNGWDEDDAWSQDAAPDDVIAPTKGKRTFPMGFLPLPHDVTAQAVAFNLQKIKSDGDLMVLRQDGGVPWVEALASQSYSGDLLATWHYQRSLVPAGHRLLLALTPANKTRDGLAPYHGEREKLPLPAPWSGYSFKSPEVAQAYLSHCVKAIEFFKPDYVSIGDELDAIVAKNPASWGDYLDLHAAVYKGLKQRYPKLPVFASWFATSLLKGWTGADHATQLLALKQLMAHSDYLGLSVFPFASKYGTGPLPATMWSELRKLSSKPIAVTAAGYLGRPVTFGGWYLDGSQPRQQRFVAELLRQAKDHGFELVVYTVVRDFDALWYVYGADDGTVAIKATGLYDAGGSPRQAHATWIKALKGGA